MKEDVSSQIQLMVVVMLHLRISTKEVIYHLQNHQADMHRSIESLPKFSFVQRFTQTFSRMQTATMASGGQPPNFRFYFHAQLASASSRILVEMIANTTAGSLAVSLKSDASKDIVTSYSNLLKQTLNSI